jgi:hypothetical protein
MKKFAFSVIFISLLSLFFSACKEEEISDQTFVKNHFIGKWPLKLTINITTKNGAITKNDTTFHGVGTPPEEFPVDTLQFTNDDKYIRDDKSFTYTIDETGDNIRYSTTPPETWKIKYLRLKSIILSQEKTEKIGNDTFIYYKEEQLIK